MRDDSANSSLESVDGASVPAAPNRQSNGLAELGTQCVNSYFETQASNEKPPKSKELARKRTEYGWCGSCTSVQHVGWIIRLPHTWCLGNVRKINECHGRSTKH